MGIEASCEWAPVSPGRERVGECFADTAGLALKARGRACPFKTVRRAWIQDFASPLSSSFALASCSLCSFASAAPPPLALSICPRLHCRDVKLDTL
jgi:hypothetical protein